MSIRVISIDAERSRRRQQTIEASIPYQLGGRNGVGGEINHVVKKMINGRFQGLSLSKPVGEMITTAAGAKELLEKVVLDVELGRETVPTLYSPIYERLEDPNFPEVFDAKWIQHGVVVFLEHLEGEEVKFGHIEAMVGPVARIKTWAAGFEYTEDMEEYNKTFEMEAFDRAMGEAFNALLNEIHFAPIRDYSYADANKTSAIYVDAEGTPKDNATGAHPLLSLRETLKAGIGDARKAKRAGSVLLIAGENEVSIQEALSTLHVRGTDFPPIGGIETIISYDGWNVDVGKRKYEYNGIASNKAYLIRPRRGFKELIKHDLRVDADVADLSRLILNQIVARARRGVFAAPVQNVQEISLPDFS